MFAKYQHFGRAWGISSLILPRIPHHLSLRSPTKSPRKLVAAAATAEEAVLVHQSRIFGRKIPHVVPQKSTAWSFRASGLNESDGFNYLGRVEEGSSKHAIDKDRISHGNLVCSVFCFAF